MIIKKVNEEGINRCMSVRPLGMAAWPVRLDITAAASVVEDAPGHQGFLWQTHTHTRIKTILTMLCVYDHINIYIHMCIYTYFDLR